jgi:flagellar hook-basal body complex protein FliE
MTVSSANLSQVLQQLQATAGQAAAKPVAQPNKTDGPDFSNALVAAIDKVDGMKQSAAAQGHAFERGVPGVGINGVMVDMQKAGLAFEMGVQVRNRVVSAYKQIMNMQV